MVDKGAWPLGDNVGFGEAMLMLWQSLQRNRTTKELVQFDTIRKLRSMSANVQSRGTVNAMEGVGFKDGGNMFGLTRCTTNSALFKKFIKGCEKKNGKKHQARCGFVRGNSASSIEAVAGLTSI
jgi:hypothetical protein